MEAPRYSSQLFTQQIPIKMALVSQCEPHITLSVTRGSREYLDLIS